MLLRAAIAVEGRSIPIYEAVYTLKQYNSPRIHMRFLEELKSLLPEGCSPIVITDAGFRGPWFKAVEALDWHWVGRIRNSIKYRLLSRKCWRYTTDLYYRANKNPTYLGPAELSHKRPYLCHLHLFKKGRSKRQTCRSVEHYRKHSSSTVFKKQQRDPWLIATNISILKSSLPSVLLPCMVNVCRSRNVFAILKATNMVSGSLSVARRISNG